MFPSVLFLIAVYNIPTTAFKMRKENNACSRFIDYPLKAFKSNCYVNHNVLASTPQMIKLNGYDLEVHDAVTKDGYISSLFRIPVQKQNNRRKGQPIVVEHGIQVNSEVWTWMGNRSLAFVLADAGYDVWLANQRDSGYTKHVKYNSSDYNFWTYSIDDLASEDVSAALKTVANITKKSSSIIYIGHSRGSTLPFMYVSENPKEAEKYLRGVVALSPIIYVQPVFYVKILCYLTPALGKVIQLLRISALNYPVKSTIQLYQTLCTILPHLCKFILLVTSGNASQFLPDDLLAFFSIFPMGISTMVLLHYGQICRSGKFRKYDYGKKGNLQKYNQEDPPVYDLRNFQLPVYMFYGKRDILIKEKAVKKVFKELGSSEKEYFSVPTEPAENKLRFGHNDFVWSKNIEKLFYDDLFRVLDKLQLDD